MKWMIACLFGLIGIILSFSSGAAEKIEKHGAETSPAVPESGWSNGSFLGPNWWLKNPRNLKSVPNAWLYHAELRYAYGEQGGNVETSSHHGSADLYLRKHLLTSVTYYDINNRDTTINLIETNTSVENQFFRQGFRYALAPRLGGVLGFQWERNSGKYLDNRTVWYGGARYHAVDSERHDLTLGLFFAPQTDTSYMNDKISGMVRYKTFPGVADYSSNAIYLAQRYRWRITEIIEFSQKLDYMNFLEDSGYYFAKLDFKLDFKFSKHTAFFVSYALNYDNNPFVDALDQYLAQRREAGLPSGDMETLDTTLGVGIKFSF